MKRNYVGIVAGCAIALCGVGPALAQDIVWEVVNPFRFYKDATSFKLHEDAFKLVVAGGAANDPQAIQKIERCLNDPKSMAGSVRTACEALVEERRVDTHLGWAAATLASTCLDYLDASQRHRFPVKCAREHAGGRVSEDYILPASHTISFGLSAERRTEAGGGTCIWSVKARAGGDWTRFDAQPCVDRKLVEVPFSKDRALSGLHVKAEAPGNRTFTADVIVEDLLIAALGDSFASGEGNPDKPVVFGKYAMNYKLPRCEPQTAAIGAIGKGALRPPKGASGDSMFILPRRYMGAGGSERLFDFCAERSEFLAAFWERSAKWLSPDCHRSQYAFPMRVALQLALENRQRAVTLVHLACSGALASSGLFAPQTERPHYDPRRTNPLRLKAEEVPAQFQQLTRLICSVVPPDNPESYVMTVFKAGETQLQDGTFNMKWCPPGKRKRDIDLVLLSIGGNDVGFSALAAYTILNRMSDVAPIAVFLDKTERFGPDVADVYLNVLDSRIEAVRKALKSGFGVDSAKVVQVSYENAEYDEQGHFCGQNPARATIGLDVHNRFSFDVDRVAKVNEFIRKLFARLQCITDAGADCPTKLKTGAGTKFSLVIEHQREFRRRGICARDPAEDERMMRMPRERPGGGFAPYLPSTYRPYAHRTRLFRTPNDAFLTANEHRRQEMLAIDVLQPVVAALLSGAFHPTAEAHAIVADHAMDPVRRALAQR